jgi:hypothetical protein
MTGSFSQHVSLLSAFLDRRSQIVDDIAKRLVNVQGKPRRERSHIQRAFESCFFGTPGLPHTLAQLRGQLASAHVADGFEPVVLEQRSHQLDPVGLIFRACDHWDRHRWPGRNGRVAFAQTLYSIFILQQLEHLSMRIWDEGDAGAGDRLQNVQSLLSRLNSDNHSNVLVRDTRWLIQTAQGPLTRHLHPYFKIACHISSSLTGSDRLEVHKAGVKLAGGHLRSQLRYRAGETGHPVDDPEVLAITRNSNSMDAALLLGDLVPVLEAYKAAEDPDRRLVLADGILQGLSADPELFLTRTDVLGPCTMIEEVFIECSRGGAPQYTPFGDAHLAHLTRYRALIAELREPLIQDALTLRAGSTTYSPLGIAYGFCADILTNMAIDGLLSRPCFDLSLEDMFVSGRHVESKLTRARGWEKPQSRAGEREHFEHSLDRAAQVFERTLAALGARAGDESGRLPSGRLFVIPESHRRESSAGPLPDGIVSAQEHYVTSDLPRALASGATAFPKSQILLDPKEGRFLASAEVDGKWFGVSKVLLTACLCQGKDALVRDVPDPVIEVLRLTCPEVLVVVSG